ncbi:GEM-like protein 1 [Ricinus communis]|uniref:GRAM domain-containing protein n=1 Tax=Ricinus communis TaxID=3988 RepID=B9RMZ9_RICCO|nr:GEM-like protein 1 [Ricinus communis]XP_048229597.1 GEM-like protein 1 [Ricinus communis]EEF47122.1 conserved hypothetical protein [Ricinus communis]|eukprot:XP_002515138.1 GEM-like protein 1 [Ricinus communis]
MMDNPTNYSNGNPYLQIAPVHSNGYGPSSRRPMSRICDALSRCGKRVDDVTRKAEVFADNVWHHLKVSSSFTDAAMARISQGTKVLTEGGHDKVFQQAFGVLPGEKLLKAYVCYLSTSSGPVIGTLYISTKRMAFSSDYPFWYYSSTGQQQRMYYKVVVQLDKLRTANPSSSRINPSEKYIQIVTTDGHDFWFMGFVSYDKALKQLTEALQCSRDSSGDIPLTTV